MMHSGSIRHHNIFHILLSLLLLFMVAYSPEGLTAEEVVVEAYLDRDVVVMGEDLTLTLSIKGARSSSRPQFPPMEAFSVEYLGSSTQFTMIGRTTSFSVEFNYCLIPLKVGKHTIPPISVEVGGRLYKSNPLTVEVLQGSGAVPSPSAPGTGGSGSDGGKGDIPEDLVDKILLTLSVDKEEAYLNEEVPVTVRVYAASGIPLRISEYPRLASKGFLISTFGKPEEKRELKNGKYYDLLEFKTTVYPVTAGELALGPARLNCQAQVKRSSRPRTRLLPFDDSFFDDFFGNYTTYDLNLESNAVNIRVKPLPDRGKPAGFLGTVGKFNMEVEPPPSEVNVGDPIPIRIVIRGKGNMKAVSAPRPSKEDGFKVYPPQIKEDSSSPVSPGEGRVVFEEVLIPMDPSINEIPAFQFSYFDPEEGAYRTIVRGPFPLKVRGAPQSRGPSDRQGAFEESENKGEEKRYASHIKTVASILKMINARIYDKYGFLSISAIPLLGLATAVIYRRRKTRDSKASDVLRRRNAPERFKRELSEAAQLLDGGKVDEFYSRLVEAVRDYLGQRFQMPAAGITSGVSTILRGRGVPEWYIKKVEDFFTICDEARFSGLAREEKIAREVLKMAEELL